MRRNTINWNLIKAVFSVNLLACISGNSYAFTSPVLPKLASEDVTENPLGRPISPLEQSWIAGLISFGGIFGPIIAGIFVNRYGRRKTLLLIGILPAISYIILMFAKTVELYYFARFLIGLGVGCVYSIIPIYIGEIAEDSNRGTCGCIMNLMYVASSLITFTIGSFISIQSLSTYCFLTSVCFIFAWYFFILESPYYLVMVGKNEEAEINLKKLRRNSCKLELEEIKMSIKASCENRKNLRDILKSKAVVKAFVIGMGLMFFQQCTGVTAVICYMHSIFIAANAALSSEASSIIISFVMLITGCVTSVLIDKIGRKILLILSLSGVCLSLIVLGTFFFLKDNDYDVSKLGLIPLASLILYFISINLGMAPAVWAVLGELFPMEIKSLASTTSIAFCFFLAFSFTMFYPNFSVAVGTAQSFWCFAVFCAVGCIFLFLFVPETKGKSLREIQYLLEGNAK